MARKRTIDPELWTDDRVYRLPSSLAVLLYIGTITQADDEGRLEWSALQLAARILPARDDVKLKDIETSMVAIVDSGLVFTYEAGRRTYGVHPNWRKHQYVNRPVKSKLPAPPADVAVDIAERTGSAPRTKASIPDSVKREVAIRYGCEPGESVGASCGCGATGEIKWSQRRDGRPGSWITLNGFEWDHIIQEAHGGETIADNLQLSCRKCNRSRNAPASAPRGTSTGNTRDGSTVGGLTQVPSVFGNRDSVSESVKLATLVARVPEPNRSELAPSVQLGKWFFEAGIEADVIPKHLEVSLGGALGFAMHHRAPCEALLSAYELTEIRRRALNLFARKKLAGEGRVNVAATPSLLSEHWEWFDTAAAPQRHRAPVVALDGGRRRSAL